MQMPIWECLLYIHLQKTLKDRSSSLFSSFELKDAKKPFKDGVIETLLKENEAILRIARPVHSAPSMTAKDEL